MRHTQRVTFPDLIRCRKSAVRSCSSSKPCICRGLPCSAVSGIPCLDGESVSGCCCHLLPMKQMISLGSQLAFSFHTCFQLCLRHQTVRLSQSFEHFINYLIQDSSTSLLFKEYFLCKRLNSFHLDYCFSWCHRSIIEIDVFLHLPLSSKG